MPRYKLFLFSVVIAGCMILAGMSLIMTYPRYQKSTEQLPEMIAENSAGSNPALLKIKEELEQAQNGASETGQAAEASETLKASARNTDAADNDGSESAASASQSGAEERIVWTGSICASKYQTLSGSETIYYVCPYIVAKTPEVSGKEPADWSLSLRFAVSVLKEGEVSDADANIQVKDIQFSVRTADGLMVAAAGYGDGEMTDMNSSSVSYQFRDRDHVTGDTSVFARLTLLAESEDETNAAADSATAESLVPADALVVNNWSFVIYEDHHAIGVFDDIQIELP